MKSNVIHIFSRQYIEVPEIPVVRKEDHIPVDDGPKRKPRKHKNTPADLSADRIEHNESVKRQYRLT